jgi:proteasome lid subunit RPN8/RPN11
MAEERKSSLYVPRISANASSRGFKRVLPKALEQARLNIRARLFDETLRKLQERSGGKRESAAIWSGRRQADTWETDRADFHHELCDDRATALSLELSEAAKFRLYEALARLRLQLVALIHTHPAEWVDLSEVDRENQVCSRIGFWSFVVPNYGNPPWRLSKMGIHIRTEEGWYRLNKTETDQMVRIQD